MTTSDYRVNRPELQHSNQSSIRMSTKRVSLIPSQIGCAEPEGYVAMSEPSLSADDIAAHLGVPKDTVYSWVSDKAMPAHKVSRLEGSSRPTKTMSGPRRGAAVFDETSPPD